MRSARRRTSRVLREFTLFAAAVLLGLTGCGGDRTEPAAKPTPDRLGGPTATPATAPARPMDSLEEPIAARLAERVRDEGLTLEYVDCPHWTGSVPATMVCKGYLDGVVGEVAVELTRSPDGGVEYDARLVEGVVATQRLVDRLQAEGYDAVDCGDTPAYPARAGLRLVCQVEEDGETVHLVATVLDPSGEVEIRDY